MGLKLYSILSNVKQLTNLEMWFRFVGEILNKECTTNFTVELYHLHESTESP